MLRSLRLLPSLCWTVAVLVVASSVASPVGAQRSAESPVPHRDVVRADDGHALVVWSKRPVATSRGAVLLLHGRTWSALPNFDLQVPALRESMMDALVDRGYAVYALDQRGYGATSRDSSQWLTPARAARDAVEVLEWIAGHGKSPTRPALFGYSQGSLTAMLAAQQSGSRISALVLYGFPLALATPTSMSSAVGARVAAAAPVLERRKTTLTGAEEDFITPDSTPQGVKEAYARAALAADPVRTDWRSEADFASLDPSALHVPVLLINGERDPYASRAYLGGFMARIAGVDRSWVVLAHADHVAHLERQAAFVDAVVTFLDRQSHQ
jgi:pimeloyl-ACP methyl ester carboxylesterase